MSPDEKALVALRSPGWDPNDHVDQYVTREAVTAFTAKYLDQHPDGTPLYRKASPVDPWAGPRNAAGDQTYRPSLWAVLDTVADPRDLTSQQVVQLVMTSDDHESYTQADWSEMVEGKVAAAKATRDAYRSKRGDRDNDDRAERGGRERLTLDNIKGHRTIPDEALSYRVKWGRTKSLKAAQKRRDLRRKTVEGVVIQPRKEEWRTMSPEQVKQYKTALDRLVAMGTLDPSAADDESAEGSPIAYLYRMGRMTSKGDRG
ncbi:MAG: hypothetical protein EOR67_28630 [Mesorhizobium sp.]|uniref:hypothetical protein n=1 Tax=Mesorhizobium sp. TaxID=1871066 RepID=UPI000FE94398|nr:hypothetical protein [Mesorhizobium sp.]RWL81901.1 MAG: hypothetical protein EOR67_28630 [Mesorhizobium sp.]RWL82283.1 MAG: hypothetical protein EOR69_16365 [Mesorhizobium sp.]RWL98652.1 MAG: hypothetical protein EOR70_12600 [Mesorhizobium sp.]